MDTTKITRITLFAGTLDAIKGKITEELLRAAYVRNIRVEGVSQEIAEAIYVEALPTVLLPVEGQFVMIGVTYCGFTLKYPLRIVGDGNFAWLLSIVKDQDGFISADQAEWLSRFQTVIPHYTVAENMIAEAVNTRPQVDAAFAVA